MAGRIEFREKLEDILSMAIGQGRKFTLDEVEKFFEDDQLSKEQIQLVCGYLMSQKIAVSGYEPMPGTVTEKKEEEEQIKLSEEEQAYIRDYLESISQMRAVDAKEQRLAEYLPKVVEVAKKLCGGEMFIGDMIQEGNISLMMALETYSDDEEAKILEEVRAGILASVEAQNETKRRDNKMVEKVSELERTLEELSKDLGRKVSIDELAMELGISEEQVEDILKLAGEESEEESE